MGKGKEIITAIEKSIRERDFGSLVRLGEDGSYVFEWKSGDVTVQGELLQEDSIGVLLNELNVQREAQPPAGETYLKTTAESIERKVNYLMEPLKIIEVDSTIHAVQLRSEKPEILETGIAYFEMILKSGKWFGHRNHLSLRRYMQQPDQERDRRSVAFPVTKKQLERLIDDLTDVL